MNEKLTKKGEELATAEQQLQLTKAKVEFLGKSLTMKDGELRQLQAKLEMV